jgi:hypothetical protein
MRRPQCPDSQNQNCPESRWSGIVGKLKARICTQAGNDDKKFRLLGIDFEKPAEIREQLGKWN